MQSVRPLCQIVPVSPDIVDGEMTVVEIAPGIDLEKDVLAHMGFTPKVADDLKTMDPALFQEDWDALPGILKA